MKWYNIIYNVPNKNLKYRFIDVLLYLLCCPRIEPMIQFASSHEQVGKSGDSVSFEFSELKEELIFLNSYSCKL